jgi:hypothetical protein
MRSRVRTGVGNEGLLTTRSQGPGTDSAAASVSAVVDYVFRQYPNVARRAGAHEYDARLPLVAPRSVAEIDDLRATLSSFVDTEGDPEVRADVAAAVQVLEHERFFLAELGHVHLGPLEWLAECDVAVYLRRPYAPLAERVAALRAHLAQLPEFLRRAEGTLPDRLPAGERLQGVEQARARAAGLRNVVDVLARQHPELTGPDVEAAASAAAAACDDFAAAVAATAPGRGCLGPDLVAEYLRAAEGIDRPAQDLLDEAEAEVAAVVAALDSVAGRCGAGNRREAMALLASQVADESIMDTFRSVLARAADFWARQDIISMPVAHPVDVRHPDQPGTAAVTFDPSGRLARPGLPDIVYLPELPDSAGPGGMNPRRQLLNDPMLELIAVHEVVAGHHAHLSAVRSGPSVIRACVPWFAACTEGWAHYTEELAVEHGLAEGRPLVEVAQLTFALEAATRLLVFLSVHMGRMRFGQAADLAATLCGWSAEQAAREVLTVASDHFGAMYTLGKLRIREWRHAEGLRTGSSGLKPFHDRITRAGSLPLAAVRDHYRDEASLLAGKENR